MELSTAQRDRACGAMLGAAAGDALGAGYEFGTPPGPGQPVKMIGGGLGPFKPGEWTDDTSMAIVIAEIAATGADLRDETALDYIAERWHGWAKTAKDVGVQTRSVLSAAGRRGICARTAREESAAFHERSGRTAGNGSLMRTAPVALAYLREEAALVEAARAVSELTHFDPDAGDACVLWCTAIRHAILTGELDARIGLGHLAINRRESWASRLDEAEKSYPSDFAANNGRVVAALQAAWSAIVTTPVPVDDPAAEVFRVDHLRLALEAAVRGGGDTDTVAAIAGALLGAAYGASAVPSHWRLVLHGWPGLTTRGLIQWPTRSSIKASPARSSTRTTAPRRPARPFGIPTTKRCGSAPPPSCTSCPQMSTPSCRCAESATSICPPGSNSSMCASSTRSARTPTSTSCYSTPCGRSSNCEPRAARYSCTALPLTAARRPLPRSTAPESGASTSIRRCVT